MKKFIYLILVVFAINLPTFAQETPKAEVYGQYSYVRVETADLNTNGFAFGAGYNFYRQGNTSLGLFADLGATYNDGSLFLYTMGPEVTYNRVFVRTLAGGARASSGGFSTNGLGLLAGGGVKIPVVKHFNARLGGDYQLARFQGVNFNCFRLGIGLGFGK